MLSKTKKDYYLNIILLLLGTICLLTGIALETLPSSIMPFSIAIHFKFLHVWASYALAMLVMIHLLLDLDWIKAMTEKKTYHE
jgi:hypothetical protein